MSETKLTNYRNVYKSDHLGVVDLEEMLETGQDLILTISHVRQEYGVAVAGKKIDANIAYFKEQVKPFVLNATNAAVIKSFVGSIMVENWNNVPVELYIDRSVKRLGVVVGGVRIRKVKPTAKAKPAFTESNFEKAKKAKATIEMIKNAYSITAEVEAQYLEYVKS